MREKDACVQTEWQQLGRKERLMNVFVNSVKYMYKETCLIIYVTIKSHTTKSSEETEQ